MTRTIRTTAATLAAATLLAGCGGTGTAEPAAPQTTRTVDIGSGPVEVPADPQRIVVLSGSLAGNFFALDAPVVGTDTSVLGVEPDTSGFPSTWAADAVEQGTEIVSSGGTGLNLEAIATAQPDLIVGGGQGITAVQAQEVLPELQEIAPTVLVPRTVTAWQDQLDVIAEVIGTHDRVPPLVGAYEARLAEVREGISVPEGPISIYLSYPSEKHYVVPETAALPLLLGELGFTLDPVRQKAPDARLVSTGDSFEVSPELLAGVADAPNLVVVALGGPTLEQLASDPLFAQLPAFQNGTVTELPALTYRPDYPAALQSLDAIEQAYSAA